MNKDNISLVGFMGSGKTVISQQLAQKLNKKLISMDAVIEENEGRPITDIFRDSGENYFRRCEKEVLREVCQEKGIVIDCGGGIVIDPENIALLKKNTVMIYLKSSPEMIYKRTKDQTHRPLLNVSDPLQEIQELLNKRKMFYEQAHYIVDANGSVNDVCREILKLMTHE